MEQEYAFICFSTKKTWHTLWNMKHKEPQILAYPVPIGLRCDMTVQFLRQRHTKWPCFLDTLGIRCDRAANNENPTKIFIHLKPWETAAYKRKLHVCCCKPWKGFARFPFSIISAQQKLFVLHENGWKKVTMNNSPQPGHSEITSPMSSNVLILSDRNTASRIYVGLYAALPRALLSFPVIT